MRNPRPTSKILAPPKTPPKVLIYDIETSPLQSYHWRIWQENIGLNQIKKDWTVLSWAARWLGAPKTQVMYQDNRAAKNVRDDKKLLAGIWKLLDTADIVITHNGKRFDQKKLNARFVLQGYQPPSGYKHIDTLQIARSTFGFTSNKLEYLAKELKANYTKLTIREFDGFALWDACLDGNKRAWNEMRLYNCVDVLALEEVYKKLIPWNNKIDFNLYSPDKKTRCSACGGTRHIKNGRHYTASNFYQRYRCMDCGAETRDMSGLLDKDSKRNLRKST